MAGEVWERHLELMKRWQELQSKPARTDWDELRDSYRFIRQGDELEPADAEGRAACAYYDKLFKEYALVNLVHYRRGLCGMRWRTADEVVAGDGQFSCGGLLPQKCGERSGLATLEVPFSYTERGAPKQALVKVRLCRPCSRRLSAARASPRSRRSPSGSSDRAPGRSRSPADTSRARNRRSRSRSRSAPRR
eukprot:TRINITY_DN12013_c0_g1_i1.p1 TRINITY_DN12013_c0_g1~~TRINITY_DN12013_c0_g1_i1.p1  ORF type:complete len:208 (+),score=52.01 TRINITY_DN12013_c0_g1_i1:51-626(+)